MTLAGRYAEFAARLAWETLPARVRALAQDLFIDWLANAAAGLFTPLGQALAELAGACPEGRAYLVGDWRPARPLDAALVNAGAAHGLEFDDSHRAGLYHPGAPTFAAALAAAQEAGAGGADLLCGAVAGYEVALRIALAVNPAHYRLFHTTGTVGAFGAAAAAARALRLDPAATAHALGLAGPRPPGSGRYCPPPRPPRTCTRPRRPTPGSWPPCWPAGASRDPPASWKAPGASSPPWRRNRWTSPAAWPAWARTG